MALLRDLIDLAGKNVSEISAPADKQRLRLVSDRVSNYVTVHITPAGGWGEAWEGATSRVAGTFTWSAGQTKPDDDGPPPMACEDALPCEAFDRLGKLFLPRPIPRPVAREVLDNDVQGDALCERL